MLGQERVDFPVVELIPSIQVLVFGCGCRKIADECCSATTIRSRRDEWIAAGVFEAIELIALQCYGRIIGLRLSDLPADGCSTKAPSGGERSGPSPVDRRKLGLKRSTITDAIGIPLAAVTAPGNCHDSPLLAPTLDRLGRLGPLPDGVTVHLDSAYGSLKGPATCAEFGLAANVAVPNAWGNQFFKLARCTERRGVVIDAYVSLIHAIVTLRRLIRQAWTLHRWDNRPKKRP
jgi:transposase